MGTTASGHPPGRYVSPAAGYAGNPSERAAAQSQGTKLHRQYVSPAAGSFASVQYLEERNEYIVKKYFLKKLLAVCTALSLLSTSAFAASFGDLQNAIDGNTDEGILLNEENGHYGYGDQLGNGSYGVESWKGEDGSHNVQLNEDVQQEEGEAGIVIDDGQDVNLDLNGSDIVGDGSSTIIEVEQGGSLTLDDTSDGEDVGAITGGHGTNTWDKPNPSAKL